MERLTIDEIIAHCKRTVRKKEALNGRDFFETELMGHYPMQEYWEHRQVAEYLEELYDYRKAEEQGLLLRLPCPVGTKVYALVNECEEMYEPSSWYTTISEESFDIYMIDAFGKEVFLTREEAESALAEKGGA